MSIETIKFQGEVYPKFQSEGFAAKFAFPFAKEILKYCQTVFDVGCSRLVWSLPGSIPIDITLQNSLLSLQDFQNNHYAFDHKDYHAMNLPGYINPDAIFSSHFLEHYKGSWVEVLEYWKSLLPVGGIVFLYLPHYSQKYWRSWNNRKHVHNLSPELLRDYFDNNEWTNIFVTEGPDLNNSFYAIAQKR